MSKFHISKNGKPSICHAQSGNCPLGGESQHYETKEKAQQAIERENNNYMLQSITKKEETTYNKFDREISPMIQNAHFIAEEAHRGQVDKMGKTYIEHPKTVAKALYPFGERAYVAGLLHDVIEDSDYDSQELLEMGIPKSVIKAVEYVSKPDKEITYQDWIKELKNTKWEEDDYLTKEELKNTGIDTNEKVPIAIIVKLADNFHNTAPSRAAGRKEGMMKRYKKARKTLAEGIPDKVINIIDNSIN